MPRAERAKKKTSKELLKVAKSQGQTSISGFLISAEALPKKEIVINNNFDNVCLQDAANYEVPEFNINTVSGSSTISSPWIKREKEFTADDKKSSENRGRFVQEEWFRNYKWFWYHRDKKVAYCGICTENTQLGDSSPFIYGEKSPGFCNWKKGTERLSEHENSNFHKLADKSTSKCGHSIECQLDDQVKLRQSLRYQGLIAHFRTLKTLLRQGISIRGHTDEDSNIIQFDRDKANDNKGIELLLKENQYFSHRIISEQEELIALEARKTLLNEVRSCDFYAIICDESSDISKTEQLSFSIRYCDEFYKVSEQFLGILPCDAGLTSEALLGYIKDILIRCNLSAQKMAAMAFDGASAMKKLAKLIKENLSIYAIFIHCFAHCNELVFKDASANSPMISDAQDLCENIYAIAGVCPKRVLLFQGVQQEMSDTSDEKRCILKLKNLSRTRWTTRGAAADVVIKKNKELQETLLRMTSDSNITSECRNKSKGLMNKLRSFPGIFSLVAMHEIACVLENNSKQLQNSTLTAEQATACIEKSHIRLQELRSEKEFQILHDKAKALTMANPDEIDSATAVEEVPAKRKRSLPSTMRDYFIQTDTSFENTEENLQDDLRHKFYHTIDIIQNAIKKRFDQKDLKILRALEKCLTEAATKSLSSGESLESIRELSEIINFEKLENDLNELPVHIKLYNKEEEKSVSTVAQICEVLNHRESSKECLTELHKLLKFYLTVPMGSATAERSFSAMRRIKSWLRATMSANSLNNKMFSSLHKDRMDNVNIEKIAKEFISVNEKRRNYFGTF